MVRSTFGVIPIRCGSDLLNKDSFTQNASELLDFIPMVLKILVVIYGF